MRARPTLNTSMDILLLLCTYVQAFTLKVSHAGSLDIEFLPPYQYS